MQTKLQAQQQKLAVECLPTLRSTSTLGPAALIAAEAWMSGMHILDANYYTACMANADYLHMHAATVRTQTTLAVLLFSLAVILSAI